MLYWGENSEHESCRNCSLLRSKTSDVKEGDTMHLVIHKGKPAIVLRYFPLVPGWKRIYMSSKIEEDMIWYDKEREKHGRLRHPSLGWKGFDAKYPGFASDPRNVRLGQIFALVKFEYIKW